jgi:hypothetical protein
MTEEVKKQSSGFNIGDRVTILATAFYVSNHVIFFKDDNGGIFFINDKEFNLKDGQTYKVTGRVEGEFSIENTYLVYTDYKYEAGVKTFKLNRVKVEDPVLK